MNMEKVRAIREKLSNGHPSLGGWILSGSATIAEAMAMSRAFDWIVIDMEHSATTMRECEHCIRAIEVGGAVALVRTMQRRSSEIDRYLDAGASGIMFADVRTESDAHDLWQNVTYRAAGHRSFSLGRSLRYGETNAAAEWSTASPLLVFMIEHDEGIMNLNTLLHDSPDAIMIGAYDLSCCYGSPGEFVGQQYQDALSRIRAECVAKQVPLGIHNPYADREAVLNLIECGYNFIGCGMDTTFVAQSSREAAGVPHYNARRQADEV